MSLAGTDQGVGLKQTYINETEVRHCTVDEKKHTSAVRSEQGGRTAAYRLLDRVTAIYHGEGRS